MSRDPTWMFERADPPATGHYLDSAATAQMLCVAHDAMARFDTEARSNVRRGIHRQADAADERYEQARASVARILGISDDEVVFTAGATAALNQLAWSLSETLKSGDEIVVTAMEHHSNFLPWQQAARRSGATLRCWQVTPEGLLDPRELDRIVIKRTRVVAVTQVSNVTGMANDLAAVADAARAVGAVLVVDAAQSVPHGLVPRQGDFFVFSGHKTYGPTGIGVLASRGGILHRLSPAFVGGGMVERVSLETSTWANGPARFEAGTPPFVQAAGLAAALEWLAASGQHDVAVRTSSLVRSAAEGLSGMPGVRIVGPAPAADRVGLVSFVVEGVHAHDVCQVLDSAQVWVRGGNLCAQPLMQALELPGVVRASFAPYNNEIDVQALLSGVEQARWLAAKGCL